MDMQKRRCPNCGAFLKKDDTECYVCGEIIIPTVNDLVSRSAPEAAEPAAPEVVEPAAPEVVEPAAPEKPVTAEKDSDYVLPVDHDSAKDTVPFEDRMPYGDDDYAGAVEDNEYKRLEKKGTRKVALVCGIIVGVAAVIAAVVCALFFTGVFGGEEKAKEVKIYFDKPSASLNLLDENGKVYNWSSDVELEYTDSKNNIETVICAPSLDRENLWECVVPADVYNVFFYMSDNPDIKTGVISDLDDGMVYYVTQISMNSKHELPIAGCMLEDFVNLGVNATEPATEPKTEKPTQKATEAPTKVEETTEPETETTPETEPQPSADDVYTVTLPESWQTDVTAIEEANCTTYFDTYNREKYDMGMLLSIYVFDADDTSYSDMNVKKIVTSSDGSKKIVMVTPRDIEFNDTDEQAYESYLALQKMTNQVISSVTPK